MTPKEAIKILEAARAKVEWNYTLDYAIAIDTAIEALQKVQDYEAQWIEDTKKPLEPLKLSSALNSEIFKLKYRMKNKPKEVNILDYTIIAALQDCLKRVIFNAEETVTVFPALFFYPKAGGRRLKH